MHARFPRRGTVEWIGLSPAARAPIRAVSLAVARPGTGLDGDRHAESGRPDHPRQVTLIQAEHLAVIGSFLGREVGPEQTRRNLVVRGISLFALRHARFRVGEALLEGTGVCAPCRRMEENLGEGGYNAMRGLGGICARVIEGGPIAVGDAVQFVSGPPPEDDE